MLLPLIFAAAAPAQIRADFFIQDGVTIGRYQQYAVQACNGADTPGEMQGGAIWELAKTRGPFIPQLTSVVMAEKELKVKTTKKQWVLRGISWGTAGVGMLTASKVMGNLSLESQAGQAVMAALPTVSLGLGVAAEQIDKAPERSVDVRVDAILPGIIKLGPHDCSDKYILWGVPTAAP